MRTKTGFWRCGHARRWHGTSVRRWRKDAYGYLRLTTTAGWWPTPLSTGRIIPPFGCRGFVSWTSSDRGRDRDESEQRGQRGERRGGRGRGGSDDRARGRDRGPREERQPQPFVRAAQTRRDGLGGRTGGGRGGGGRGGGRPGGRGGDRDGGPRRGDRHDDGGERVRLDSLEPSRKPAFSPFASFFKAKQAEKTVEGE